MRPLNDQEWKELQETIKKIDEEPSAIGVDFYVASFIITKDGIKNISGRRLLKRTKREKPYKAKISALMGILKSMFLNRNRTERGESVREKFIRARKVKKKKEKEFKKKLKNIKKKKKKEKKIKI